MSLPPEVRRLRSEGMRHWWARNPVARAWAAERMRALWARRREEARALGRPMRGIERIEP
jgi:hypothetical protein